MRSGLLTSPPIGEALALDTRERANGALHILDPERRAIGIAEIKLGEVALQVLLRNVVIRSDDALPLKGGG